MSEEQKLRRVVKLEGDGTGAGSTIYLDDGSTLELVRSAAYHVDGYGLGVLTLEIHGVEVDIKGWDEEQAQAAFASERRKRLLQTE